MSRKFGFSFDWRHALGLAAAGARQSRRTGNAISPSGRQRKIGPGATAACLLLLLPCLARAQAGAPRATQAIVRGTVLDASTHAPVAAAGVVLRSRADTTQTYGTTTDTEGAFTIARVPFGTYVLECSLVGHAGYRSPPIVLDAGNAMHALKPIELKPSTFLLDEMVVNSEKSLFHHDVDRRVYDVDKDLMARSSTAAEVLQNIPSVQVDLDGNVSLRGSPNVMIIVNGKKSPLMGTARGDVLQQLPASSIEKIEVITNPSARFTPEGTSGIINIVLKQGAGPGTSGDATVHGGENGRHNESVALSGHRGKIDLFGNYSYRDDRRNRFGVDDRTFAVGGASPTAAYLQDDHVAQVPHVHIASAGVTWHTSPHNSLDLSGNYYRRKPSREEFSTIVTRDTAGAVLTDHDRAQSGFEVNQAAGLTTAFEHDFAREGHTLRIEATGSASPQTEQAHFVELWRTPVQPGPAGDLFFHESEREGQVNADYVNPLGPSSKLEAGYALDRHRQDIGSDADSLDTSSDVYIPNPAKTYRFRLDQTVQAVYATYARAFGKLEAQAGLRGEHATVTSDLVTGGVGFTDRYLGLYPTLHLTHKIGKTDEAQFSYSRRIRRPESDDLNPFPEFTDPYNEEQGNPRLRPESIHSVELGYRMERNRWSFTPTVYYRYRTDAFTRLTIALTDSTFLRTPRNLAKDQSGGFEPVITLSLGHALQGNLSADIFHEQIDATNLGFAGTKSVTSWSGNASLASTPRTGTTLQVNAIYRSGRLSPQGQSRGSFLFNVGARQALWHNRLAATLAVSDLLATQRQETDLDVGGIAQRVSTRRDARVVYVGLSYHYGRGEQKAKDKTIQYEDQP